MLHEYKTAHASATWAVAPSRTHDISAVHEPRQPVKPPLELSPVPTYEPRQPVKPPLEVSPVPTYESRQPVKPPLELSPVPTYEPRQPVKPPLELFAVPTYESRQPVKPPLELSAAHKSRQPVKPSLAPEHLSRSPFQRSAFRASRNSPLHHRAQVPTEKVAVKGEPALPLPPASPTLRPADSLDASCPASFSDIKHEIPSDEPPLITEAPLLPPQDSSTSSDEAPRRRKRSLPSPQRSMPKRPKTTTPCDRLMDQYIWAPLRSLDSFSGGVTAESVQVLLKMEETVNREIVLLGAYRRLLSAPRPLGKAPLTRSAQYKQFVWYLCLAIVQNLEPWKSTETEAQFVPLDAGLWGDTRVALCYLLLCLINSTADPDVRSVWDAWTDLQVTFFDVIKASKNGASLSLFKSATTEILRHYSILMEEIGVATLDGVLVVAELLPASFVSGLQDPRLPDEIPTSLDFLQGEPVTSLCPRKSLPDFYFCQKGVSLPIIEWELTDSEESEELSPAPLPTPPDISVETSDRFCNRVIRQRIRVWHERDAALRPLLRQMHKHWVRDVVTPVEDMRRTDAFEWGSLPFRASAGWRDRLVPCPMGYVTRDPTWKPSHVPVDLPNFPSSQVQRLNSAEIPLGLDGIVRPYGKHRATPFNRKRPPDLKAKSGQLSYMNALFTNVPGAPPGWYGSLANLGRSVDAFYVFDQREISVSSLMRPDPDPHLTHTLTLTRQMWSFSQIAIFVERYVSCPKNFRRISQAVPGKTSRQCVDFYYVMKHLLSLDHLTKAFYQRPHDLQDALVHPLLDKLAELTTSEPDWHDTVVEMVLMFVANTQLSILSEGPGAKPLVRLYEALGKPTQVVPPTRRHQTAKLLVVLTALLPVLSIMRDPDRSRLRNGVWSVPELAELLRHQGTPSAFSLADWRTFESGKHQARASRRKTKSRLNALSLVPNLDTGYFLPDLIGTLQLPSKTCLVNGREVGTGIFCGMRPPLQVFYDFCRKVGGGDPATTSPAPKLPSGFSAVVDSGLLNAKNHTR